MDEIRKGEIALAILKNHARRTGVRITPNNKDIGRIAEETGIPAHELREFTRDTIHEMIEEWFVSNHKD